MSCALFIPDVNKRPPAARPSDARWRLSAEHGLPCKVGVLTFEWEMFLAAFDHFT